jgi:hypothetical protein
MPALSERTRQGPEGPAGPTRPLPRCPLGPSTDRLGPAPGSTRTHLVATDEGRPWTAPALGPLTWRLPVRGWCNRQHYRFWPCHWGFESSPPSPHPPVFVAALNRPSRPSPGWRGLGGEGSRSWPAGSRPPWSRPRWCAQSSRPSGLISALPASSAFASPEAPWLRDYFACNACLHSRKGTVGAR